MKLIIEHLKTKREVSGAFALCCGKEELEQLKSIIDQKLNEDFSYGWIYFDEQITSLDESDFHIIKRQKQNANTTPISWDYSVI